MTHKDDHDKIVLDYSSEAEEHKAAEQREAERRKALGDYNEATSASATRSLRPF